MLLKSVTQIIQRVLFIFAIESVFAKSFLKENIEERENQIRTKSDAQIVAIAMNFVKSGTVVLNSDVNIRNRII